MDATGQSSPTGQILYSVTVLIILFLTLFLSEILYNATLNASERFITLLGVTANAEDKALVIAQDASKYMNAKPIGLSVNERTGIEFGYSFYMYIQPSTFDGQATLRHVWHKGYPEVWPLIGPGVFLHGHTNTMRIVMNTYKTPYTFADVTNIPVDKWFHVVLNCYKGGLDIFVNGHLANRISFLDTLPYQNFQNVYLFSNINRNSYRGSAIPALGGQDFQLQGTFKGYLSNLIYTRYAMSVSEIQALMAKGPSSQIEKKTMQQPPYFADDWWAHQ